MGSLYVLDNNSFMCIAKIFPQPLSCFVCVCFVFFFNFVNGVLCIEVFKIELIYLSFPLDISFYWLRNACGFAIYTLPLFSQLSHACSTLLTLESTCSTGLGRQSGPLLS